MLIFYFFAAIVIWLGILSLRGGLRFAAYVRRETARPLPDFTPFASVIAPFRGLEDGLRENIGALFAQDYPAYEIVLVTDRADDPALSLVEEVLRTEIHRPQSRSYRMSGEALIAGRKCTTCE